MLSSLFLASISWLSSLLLALIFCVLLFYIFTAFLHLFEVGFLCLS